MTQAQTHMSPQSPFDQETGGSNGIGLAGFITSLVALITCGLLSPISLLLSIIGLFKQPRGFAIAGTIISVVGLLLLGVVGLFTVGTYYVAQEVAGSFQNLMVMGEAQPLIQAHYQQNDALPTDEEGNTIMGQLQLVSGAPPRYAVASETEYTLTFPGEDGVFDTEDDNIMTIDVTTGEPNLDHWGYDDTTEFEIPDDVQQQIDEATEAVENHQ